MFTRIFVCLALCAPLAYSQQTVLPLISDAVDNATGTQLTIDGSGFGNKIPSVNLSGTGLTVVKSSDTQIIASVPASLAPGAYVLTVTNATTHLPGVFDAQVGPSVGPAGATGPQGPPGTMGSQGMVGATGAAGMRGSQGAVGLPGATGATGLAGPQGAVGAQGLPGLPGANGVNGATGTPGPVGTQGPGGNPGVAGPTGATGNAGPAGTAGPASPAVQLWTANLMTPSAAALASDQLLGETFYGLPLGASSLQFAGTSDTPPNSTVLLAPQSCTVGNFTVSSAASLNGAEVELRNNNNSLLAYCSTDGTGGCTFPGGAAVHIGDELSILVHNPPLLLPPSQPIYVSFTCQ